MFTDPSHPMFTFVLCRICLFQNLWRSVLLISIFLDQAAADAVDAENNGNCPPSSCGEIHGITYPFRLDIDPANCGFSSFGGDKSFTLYCHNNSSLFLYPRNNSGRFLVKGINYDNFTIRLVDPGVQQRNCSSLPISPISLNYDDSFYTTEIWRVSCQPNCKGYCYFDEAHRPTCQLYDDAQYYHIRAWFLFIYGPFLHAKRYYGPIFKITGWLMIILTLLGALRVAIFLLGSPCIFAFFIYQWRRRHLSLYDTIEEFLQNHNDLMPIRYSYKDIKKITSYFKDKLGEGGFGCVYKGKLRSGRLAAIKILGKPSKVTNGQDFMNEVATIGRIHHVNVVQLVGYCAEQSNRALLYDFMPNGSLDKYIFPKEGFVSLSWYKLFEISLGVARGIEYLHRGCDIQILHFDIKPHNILLDENFIPKVSDFGLAKLYPAAKDTIASLTAARGTIGYMAPELFYKNIGRVSYKADVYSFGMLLLEIAGKRKNLNALVEKSSQIYFPSWVYDQISNGDDIEIGDNATEGEIKIVKKMIMVGLWCIQMKPSNRPSMNKVMEMLEGDVESLEMPPKPTLCLEEMSNIGEINKSSDMSDNFSESISLIESAG